MGCADFVFMSSLIHSGLEFRFLVPFGVQGYMLLSQTSANYIGFNLSFNVTWNFCLRHGAGQLVSQLGVSPILPQGSRKVLYISELLRSKKGRKEFGKRVADGGRFGLCLWVLSSFNLSACHAAKAATGAVRLLCASA